MRQYADNADDTGTGRAVKVRGNPDGKSHPANLWLGPSCSSSSGPKPAPDKSQDQARIKPGQVAGFLHHCRDLGEGRQQASIPSAGHEFENHGGSQNSRRADDSAGMVLRHLFPLRPRSIPPPSRSHERAYGIQGDRRRAGDSAGMVLKHLFPSGREAPSPIAFSRTRHREKKKRGPFRDRAFQKIYRDQPSSASSLLPSTLMVRIVLTSG